MSKENILLLNDFYYDEKYKIYRNKSPYCTINYSDGYKAEKYILESIKAASDVSSQSEELTNYIKNWASCYHFNVNRPNIIRALDLSNDLNVLEIGSGCGAITRYLGEHFKSVDAVEGSKYRAIITRERCRDLNNVSVYNTNIECMSLPSSYYDIITLIGVLEYSPMYMRNTPPREAFKKLLYLTQHALKDNGMLIVAIENKIGLKYWEGDLEDHTGKAFEGINDYPNNYGPVTFTRFELTNLLKESGFEAIKFFSCFPDYKLATTIINNEKVKMEHRIYNWVEFPTVRFANHRLFHEGLALKTLYKGKIFNEFANSFLVVASKHKLPSSFFNANWIAKKFSLKRRPEFRTITILTDHNKTTQKIRTSAENKETISIYSNGLTIKHIVSTERWIEGDLLVFEISKLIFRKDFKEKFLALLKEYNNKLLNVHSLGKFDKEGYPIVSGKAFDFIFRNIIRSLNGNLEQIDKEWDISPITAEFVVYRTIKNDILISQWPWIQNIVKNRKRFIIETIQYLYPQYNAKRYLKNLVLDKKIGSLITNHVNYYCPQSNSSRKNDTIIAKIWHILPLGMRKQILHILKGV